MSSKESILGRIRAGLTVPAPMPGTHETAISEKGHATPSSFVQWLPSVGSEYEDRLNLFARNAEMLKATLKCVPTREAATEVIRQLAQSNQWKKIASHSHELTDAICRNLNMEILKTDGGFAVDALESCDASVTTCEALVAQTGSVLITSRNSGGRAISVLPPHHIVLATKDQLVTNLTAAFNLIRKRYEGNYPSCISYITGPSRTGDIERILVLGAHGPKQLTILLIG